MSVDGCASTSSAYSSDYFLQHNIATLRKRGVSPDVLISLLPPEARRSLDNIVEPEKNAQGLVPLTVLLEDMKVTASQIKKAAKYVVVLMTENKEEWKGKYEVKGRGYLISAGPEVKDTLRPILEEQGFFRRKKKGIWGYLHEAAYQHEIQQ